MDINPSIPIANQPNSSEEPKIVTALSQLVATINDIDEANLSATLADKIGISASRRGKSIVPTSETRTNVAYGLMTTPDRVSSIVLPTDGLICVAYQATWQESVFGAAAANIYLGANQVLIAGDFGDAPATMVTNVSALAANGTTQLTATDRPLFTTSGGLRSIRGRVGTGYTGDLTTGQIVGALGDAGDTTTTRPAGGPCVIFAAAGTYDVSVQFKASSGSVTVKNRKLWVWSFGF